LKTSFFQKIQTPQKRGTQSSHTQRNKNTESRLSAWSTWALKQKHS